MVLYFIGVGLNDEKDISVKGLEAVRKCSKVFLESYTSKLNCSVGKLEKFYGQKVVLADREMVEKMAEVILKDALKKDVAFLVIGDVFSATTHVDLMLRAKEKGIKVKVIHNASILTAVGVTGLELYKFGKVTSIPFDNENVKSPVDVLKGNQKLGLHTLFLLDLDPIENKFLSIKEGIQYLIKNKIKNDTLAVACARLGSEEPVIKVGKLKELEKVKIDKFPQCLIIPGKLHFMEEDALKAYN
jgi:diphthine synthase